MASSSKNPNPITALDDEDSLEFFPRIRTRNDDQDLQQAVDRFLHVESPNSSLVSHPAQVSATFTQPALSTPSLAMQNSSPLPAMKTMQTSIPQPIMIDSVTTHAAKGKAIAMSPTSHPSQFRGSKGVVINEPCPTISTAISLATRRTFTRQNAQAGDSMRTLDHKNSLTGTDFIFKIGHHRVVASHYRLLPGASTPIFAEGSWQDHSALSGLVSQIRILFSNFPEASLHFLPRQFNMDAHGLAKEAIRSREEV
ncbi:hypothetical protein F8388_005626 [Cannabis sativa]|uniref:RNase H type-1 domain-containing protein n=1 Tax=Cannabis sativa TaxID=3483 RepID=A0A7J6FVK0_CANSA|nr:hypothetical protein F8388_005626 [Cannabis sativa]KAF4373770.1 hypothetical protein G4B88_009344 [Cannabis sativa]